MITNRNGFQVVCTNPAKGSIESCWFDQSEWTVIDAVEQFCRDYDLELSEVRVEPMDDSGEVVVSRIVEGVEVHRVFAHKHNLTPDPAHDVTGNGEDNQHSWVYFGDKHVGDIQGDEVATVTTIVE